MNFVNNQKDIKNKLLNGKRVAGCYIYSRRKNDNIFKIGMSINLFGRMNALKSAYPQKNEFYIHMFIFSKNPRQIEAKLLSNKMLCKLPKNTNSQGLRPREFRRAPKSILYKSVKQTLRDNNKLWKELIIFSSHCWHHHKIL